MEFAACACNLTTLFAGTMASEQLEEGNGVYQGETRGQHHVIDLVKGVAAATAETAKLETVTCRVIPSSLPSQLQELVAGAISESGTGFDFVSGSTWQGKLNLYSAPSRRVSMNHAALVMLSPPLRLLAGLAWLADGCSLGDEGF